MLQLDRLLEGANLMAVYAALAIFGVLLTLTAMQMSWNEALERNRLQGDDSDPPFMLNLRRGSFVLVALMLLWSLSYAETKGWQPWPPTIGIVFALDFYLGVLIVMIARKSRAAWHDTPRVRIDGTIDH